MALAYNPMGKGGWNIHNVTADSPYIPLSAAIGPGVRYSISSRRAINLRIQQLKSQRGGQQSARGALTREYQTAYSEAKEANIKRYQEILAGYKTRYSTAMTGLKESRAEIMGGLEGLGEEELAGIGRRYTRERASTAQHLISTGLHATTVAPAVQAGVTRREGYAMSEAQERLRRERLGYLKQLSDRELLMQTGMTKEELDFKERREDLYPSESLYVQLMQGLGGSS